MKEDAKLISAIAEKFVLIYKAKDAFRVTDLSIQEMTKVSCKTTLHYIHMFNTVH